MAEPDAPPEPPPSAAHPPLPRPPRAPQPPDPPGARAALRGRRLQALDPLLRAFRAYARWLVAISWLRFALMALLLLVLGSVLENLPPFNWTISETLRPPRAAPDPAAPPSEPARVPYDVHVDAQGAVRIEPRASRADADADADSGGSALPGVRIVLPPGVEPEALRKALEAARQSIEDTMAEHREAAVELARPRVIRVRLGDFLTDAALALIFLSAIIKISYRGRLQAEAATARAVETAEGEQLRRQLAEARMAAMQAQVEPHFLFNTLASIDHLIETDPRRASAMQKQLIALLRAAMPAMRDTAPAGRGDLGREMALVRPYLEILHMRMEERLQSGIDVPEGLLSAEFPPLMLQGLVENAIKHGLEPKAEGGRLDLRAEVAHGELVLTVEDDGLGFGQGPTAGTGVGLANLRERLRLLYGDAASLGITAPPGGGTRVRLVLPYRPMAAARAAVAPASPPDGPPGPAA